MCTKGLSTVSRSASNGCGFTLVENQKRPRMCVLNFTAFIRLFLTKGQAFFQEAAVWKRLEHPNIVPLLGVTVAPLQLVSVRMAGGEILEYIERNPSTDRLSLVGFCSATLNGAPIPSPDF